MNSVCMKTLVNFGVSIFCFFFLSCEEEFNVDMPNSVADGIVFHGLISNGPPPYFFHLTKPTFISADKYHFEGINDAEVVIEDATAGVKDTLQLLVPQKGQFSWLSYYYYDYHIHETVEKTFSADEWPRSSGIYATTKIHGIEGHTYILDIYYKGVHHTATETMLPKTMITSLKLKSFDQGDGKTSTWAPAISFINQPDVDNYYLLHVDEYSSLVDPISSIVRLFTASEDWSYSILSDEHLGEKVDDLLVSDGEGVRNLAPGSHYPAGADSVFVTIESISKACYDIFDKVIDQLRTDGGAYTPTPTSVKSNISGNVWGIFRVSAYTEKGLIVDRKHKN